MDLFAKLDHFDVFKVVKNQHKVITPRFFVSGNVFKLEKALQDCVRDRTTGSKQQINNREGNRV